MTEQLRKARLEYNSFYIAGQHDVDVPTAMRGEPFAQSPRCINVGCRMWQDGEVEITLAASGEIEREDAPALDTSISTPQKQVLLFDANHPELLKLAVSTRRTRIRVWTNHATEPDRITVIVGD
jgi:hypothetical protein